MVGVEELLEFSGRRKSIESDNRSGILDKRQEKAMGKTTTKLCLMLAMFHLVRIAVAIAFESNGWQKKTLKDNLIIFSKKLRGTWLAQLPKRYPLSCTVLPELNYFHP